MAIRNKHIGKIIAAACAACILLAGCSGGDETGNPDTGEATGIAPPDNYADNSEDPGDTGNILEYTSGELHASIGGIDGAAVRDEQAYISGEGFQYRFAANLMTADNNGSAPCISDMKADIEKIRIAGKEYGYDDLIRDKTQGLEVVKMLAEDFGVNKCDGSGVLIERLGNVQDTDELRNAYSDRVEYDSYTACAYYFDARMNDLDDDTYDEYRRLYARKYDTDTSECLDGVLSVILYYDTDGHDYFYTIVLSAPTYYSSRKNFEANMRTNIRKDITNCHAELKDGLKVGFVNRTAIMCDDMPESDA